jgi:hypothetical protein
MLVFAINLLIHFVCAVLTIKSRIDIRVLYSKVKKGEIISESCHQGERLGMRDYSHLELTDVLQQGVGRVIPLSLHAPPKYHEQARSPLCEAKAVLLVGLDILGCRVSARKRRARDKLERLATHSDDLNDGKKNSRRRHRGWKLQHGRDIGGNLGGGDHPVNRIVARTPSDGSEGHKSYELKKMLKGPPGPSNPPRTVEDKVQ